MRKIAQLEEEVKQGSGANLVEAMEKQTAAVVAAVKGKDSRPLSSTIKITPQIKWPTLGDDRDGDRCDVGDFFTKVEDNCKMANDGQGMLPSEQLTVLKQCLKGSKEKIYNNMQKVFIVLVYTVPVLVIFIWSDNVDWIIGLVLAAGSAIGGWLAARVSLKGGEPVVRMALVAALLIMSLKLLNVI